MAKEKKQPNYNGKSEKRMTNNWHSLCVIVVQSMARFTQNF